MNDFLSGHRKPEVSQNRFAEIDRWSTTRKFVEGVEMTYGRLFSTDDEVMLVLDSCSACATILLHPRPGAGPPMAHMPDPSWRELYPPARVADWLVAVAGAASAMEMRCYGFDYQSTPASAIWHGRRMVREHAAQADPLPSANQAGRPPLLQLLYEEMRRTTEAFDGHFLTVHELRGARTRLAAREGAWDTFTELLARQTRRHADDDCPR